MKEEKVVKEEEGFGGPQNVEPAGWKVIFLAEILVEVLWTKGADLIPSHSQPNACVVLVLISEVQLPACEK